MYYTISKLMTVKEIYSLPLKMSFCEAGGTPVACVRASERSLTVRPLPSSCAVTVMLCLVDPEVRENH